MGRQHHMGKFAATRAMDQSSRKVSAWTLMKTSQVHILKHHRSPPRIHEVSLGSMRVSFLTISIDLYPRCLALRTHAFYVFASSSNQNGADGACLEQGSLENRDHSILCYFNNTYSGFGQYRKLVDIVRLCCWPSLFLAHVNWDKPPPLPHTDQTIHWAFAPLALCLPQALPGLLVLSSQPFFI